MYSDNDYYYKKNSFNISQSTINVIIVIVLLVIFFFIFNYCSKNYFTNLNCTSDNQYDDLKNELAFVKEELFNKNYSYKQTNDDPVRASTSVDGVKNETINEVKNETINEVKLPETQKIYNTDFLLNGDININNPKQNITPKVVQNITPKVVQNITPKVVQNITPKVVQNRIPFVIQDPNMNYQNDFINYQNDFINYNNLLNTPNNDIFVQQFVPPIIYDPIENYDRLKLTDPLIDPRGRSSADQIPTPQVAAQLNFPTQGIIDRYHRVGLLKAIDKHHQPNHKNNRRRNSYEDFNNVETDSHEDFGNIEKIVKGKKVNIDSDSSNSDNNTSNLSKYSDNSSDLQTISSSYNTKFKEKIIPNNVVLDIGDRDNDILELIGKKIANEWYRYFTSISKGNKIIKINVHNKNRKELYDGDVVYIPILKRHYRVKIDKMDMIDYNPYFF